MRRRLIAFAIAVAALGPGPAAAQVKQSITVFFPVFAVEDASGEAGGAAGDHLGRNVATVLALQLAQTSRSRPWPDNPRGLDFGDAVIRPSPVSLPEQTHDRAAAAAAAPDLLAQIVVWGDARAYAGEVVADVSVTLPAYASPDECARAPAPCDWRTENFERWTVDTAGGPLSVEPPSRRFTLSSVPLRAEVLAAFREAAGLAIRPGIDGGTEIGRTGSDILFLEFNPRLPGAPTKLRSGGVTGYVELPAISEAASEYADMVGGVLKVFRGDWDGAVSSFGRVLDLPATREPLRVDALLYRGMARYRGGGDGAADFRQAIERAPLDRRAVQYAVVGLLSTGGDQARAEARGLLEASAYLFDPGSDWWLGAQAATTAP